MSLNNIVKCIVAAVNANGEPDLFFCAIKCTQDHYDNGLHYDMACELAEENGYEPKLAFDENDAAGRAMLVLCEWDSIPVHDMTANPAERRCPECRETFSSDGEGHSFDAIAEFGKCTDCLGECPYCKQCSECGEDVNNVDAIKCTECGNWFCSDCYNQNLEGCKAHEKLGC